MRVFYLSTARYFDCKFLFIDTKRLPYFLPVQNSLSLFCRPEEESFAFSGTLRCAYDALRFGFKRIAMKQSVRRDEVTRSYGVSGSLFN